MNDAAYDADYFLAGFWQIGDPTGWVQADAAGQPIVVHGLYGDGRVTFFGPLPAFRAGTEAHLPAARQRDLHGELRRQA